LSDRGQTRSISGDLQRFQSIETLWRTNTTLAGRVPAVFGRSVEEAIAEL
jgi:hypothetical protein